MSTERYALTLSCPDRPGIVASVTGALFENGANILEAHQFDDEETRLFFARIAFDFIAEKRITAPRGSLTALAESLRMTWSVLDLDTPQRVLLLVSGFDHCLSDLLYRWRIGELAMDVVGIVSNHPRETYRHLDFDSIPFDFLPVSKETKAQQEAQLLQIVSERNVEAQFLLDGAHPSTSNTMPSFPSALQRCMSFTVDSRQNSSGRCAIHCRMKDRTLTCSAQDMFAKPTFSDMTFTPAARYLSSCGKKLASARNGMQPWLSHTTAEPSSSRLRRSVVFVPRDMPSLGPKRRLTCT